MVEEEAALAKKVVSFQHVVLALASCLGSLWLGRNERKMLTKRKCKMSMSSTVQFSATIASQFS